MKKLLLAAIVFSILATISTAQETPIADVAAGYSVIQVVRGINVTANGGSGSAALNITRWFGIAGDLGIYHTTENGSGLTAVTYSAGPRFSYRHWNRVTPFGQVLIGGAHASAPSNFTITNALALGLGGGADFGLDHGGRFALRPQVEYFGFGAPSDFGFGNATRTVRVSLGIVYRIPRR